MSALHYTGKNDTKEQGFMINAHQEQAMLLTLLQGRDPDLYWQRPTRGVWQERGYAVL